MVLGGGGMSEDCLMYESSPPLAPKEAHVRGGKQHISHAHAIPHSAVVDSLALSLLSTVLLLCIYADERALAKLKKVVLVIFIYVFRCSGDNIVYLNKLSLFSLQP